MSKKVLNKMILDAADAYSYNAETASEYLAEEGLDFENYLARGLDELERIKNKMNAPKLTKSQTFFRRVVLAARIADEYHNEWTFGSVKFQKLIYLCEQVSEMEFNTRYTKQAAGPMDNRFLHAVKQEFERLKWFKVTKEQGDYGKVSFKPLESIKAYESYYQQYYYEVDSQIQQLLEIFRKWKTEEVELVATIYACWDEINKEESVLSDELIIQKVYAWHKKKKRFSELDISKSLNWMKQEGIHPSNKN